MNAGWQPSGVRGLGVVPADWRAGALRQFTTFDTGWTPPTDNPLNFDGDVPWANISDLGPKILDAPLRTVASDAEGAARQRLVETGELLFSFKLSVGSVSMAGAPMHTNEAIARFDDSPNLLSRYAFYALPVMVTRNCNFNIYGAPLLNRELIRQAPVALPSIQQQGIIADFLDRETAQIDAMIDAQKIVRERLFELRSALAERLIIYGVSGSAGFRESGLPWAPELPAHWQVGKVLRGYTVTLGKMLDEKRVSFVDDVQTPYIRAANIQDHGLDLSDVKTMPFRPIELRRLDLRAGDLLVVEGGSIGTNVVLANDLPDFSFQKTVNRARPRSEHDSRYLGHWLKMLRDHGVLAMMGNQSTIAHFTAEKLKALPVPFPPASEQREIADRIEAQTRDLDRSIAAAIDLEALLRERREALITAAVTGRIDPTTGIERIDPMTEKEAS